MFLAQWVRRGSALGVVVPALIVLGGCAARSPQELAEKDRLLTSYPPSGQARIWIFRTDQPEISRQTPYVRINGQIIGVSYVGRAFYRDVPPGDYEITVDSRGVAPNQFAHVGLAPGQTAYVEVDVNNWWAGVCWHCQIDTFYTLVQNPALARAEIASLPLVPGG